MLIFVGAFRLISGERRRSRLANFDTLGAILLTAGMLLLVYALVRAPDVGWGKAGTIGELAGAAVLLTAFVVNERRQRNPLVPLSIFQINGLAAADATQLIAMAGFYSMFFFLTLYMQTVLGYSPIQAGSAYLPVTLGVAISSGISSQLFARTGTRPIIVAGALLAAGGLYWLSRIPVHGSYLTDLLPGPDDHVVRPRRGLRRRHRPPPTPASRPTRRASPRPWSTHPRGSAVRSGSRCSLHSRPRGHTISWPPTHRNTKPSSRAFTVRYSRAAWSSSPPR